MRKEEIWGVSIDRARAFFRSQADVLEDSPDVYTFHTVRITLEELEPSRTGIWSARRIRLGMEGPDAELKAIHHRYFMQFLSTGG